MTVKEKQKELHNYNFLIVELADLKDRYEMTYTQAIKITQTFDNIGHGSGVTDKTAEACSKLYDISIKIDKMEARINRIDRAVNALPYYHRKLIKTIDIDNVSMYRSAAILHRSYNSIKAAHTKALENLNL